MSNYLGFDTSNYTTSVALYDSESNKIIQKKQLLPVKSGEKGLRQSDAVFHHTVQLPELVKELFSEKNSKPDAVGVSYAPTTEKGSYMPCFLTGISAAQSVASANSIPLYKFSHQQGHIAAVLFAGGREDLLNKNFIAFHLSGGTTQGLLVKPDRETVFDISLVSDSLDLKAGQAVDRVGLMLGLDFPCGAKLDLLSQRSEKIYNIKPYIKDGCCSLSGVENRCKKMLDDGEKAEDIARFCIMSIIAGVDKMAQSLIEKYGNLPILFSGGVSSNSLLQKHFKEKYNAVFASTEFSCDNAAGIAFLTYLKNNRD